MGQRLAFWGRERTIIGVVGNERFRGLVEEAPPAAYPPLAQVPIGSASLLARADEGAEPALKAVWALDPELALSGVEGLDQTLAQIIARPRFTTLLLGLFAALALVLASIGVHGLLELRRGPADPGDRNPARARRAAGRRSSAWSRAEAWCSALAGTVSACWARSRSRGLLRSLLFGVGPADPVSFAAAPLILIAVAASPAISRPAAPRGWIP